MNTSRREYESREGEHVNPEVRIPHHVNEPTCKRGPFRFGDRAGLISLGKSTGSLSPRALRRTMRSPSHAGSAEAGLDANDCRL